MPTRGTPIKRESQGTLTLSRAMVTRRDELTHRRETCCGCQICALVCPHEAITHPEPVLVDGRLPVVSPLDIDEHKCSFCGECVVMCPTHSLAMQVNGRPEVPVVKGEAFPLLVRTNKVDVEACRQSTDTAYVDNCPVGAIRIEAERDAQGAVIAVREVEVDRGLCINCTRCMEEGPEGGFTVVKPYKGRIWLDISLCPEGCQACADVCPTHAITYDGRQVVLDARYCLFCGACENVCPAEGAVRVVRSGFVHTPVSSGAWTRALEALVSYREAAREHDIKGQQKRRRAVLAGLLMEMEPDGGAAR